MGKEKERGQIMLRKQVKEFRMYSGGGYPETQKEREDFYSFMERTGIFRQIFDGKEIIARELRQSGGRSERWRDLKIEH